MRKQVVYLAGGFKSNWAKKVKECSDNFVWIDPKQKEVGKTLNVDQYGKWDLHFIRQSDIVFVYAHRDNLSCIGLSCEAGYAKGLGKTVISVLEEGRMDLSFITQVSDITFKTLKEGIDYLILFEND